MQFSPVSWQNKRDPQKAMSQIQEIKDRLDILEIAGERIQLQRSGKNYRATCPFHSEKTPSFYVSPELQRFICFGCRKQGDVFTFVQEFDRLTFPETMELLAEKAGVELEKTFHDPQEDQRRRLLTILDHAQKYYSFLLQEHAIGEPGREYLKERGTHSQVQKTFGLGYAPSGWDHLTTYLAKKKKHSLEDIVATGLAIKSQKGGIYDRFRHRLMFPLHDHRGRVVGFSGRLLDATAKEAKYINTPETALYHKRTLLFGYWQNLEFIRDKEAVIITEGEFDVLSSTQAHVGNIVAIKGSALTEEQIRILARTVKTIYLALDADGAGIEATKRAITLVQNFPVALRVIPLHGGKDPDDLARSTPKGWREMTKQHVSAFEYVLDQSFAQQDADTADGQKNITNEMLTLLSTIDHAVERTFYLRQLAERLGVGEHVLQEQWETQQKQHTAQSLAPKRPVAKTDDDTKNAETPTSGQTEDSQGAYMVQLLVRQDPAQLPKDLTINPEWFALPIHRRIVAAYVEWPESHESWSLAMFSARLPDELKQELSQLYLTELTVESSLVAQEIALSATQLEQRWRRQELEKVGARLSELETLFESSESEPTAEQEAEYSTLQERLKNLTKS